MGLFSRLRARDPFEVEAEIDAAVMAADRDFQPQWLAGSAEIEVCPAYLMEDECAGDHAFGARFGSVSAPGSVLTIWAFPAECGPSTPGCWFVAYKTEYEWAGQEAPVPAHLYHGDVACAEWYGDLDTATEAARTAAASLVILGRHANAQHVPAEVIDGWFGWDGAPW